MATGKTCGTCTLCCKLLHIAELQKPKDHWCPHVVPRKGCGIYATRPGSCQAFQCLWLVDASLGEEWKPAKSKFVIAIEPRRLAVYVDAGAVRPWMREPYLSHLKKISAQGLDVGAMVLVIENGETVLILPDRGVMLGVVASDDRIVLNKVMTPAGPRFEPSVVKAGDAEKMGPVGTGWYTPA
jgi:hypothetical protein